MSGPVFLILRILFTASLYFFLGYVLFLLSRDLRQQSALVTNREVPPLSLMIQDKTLSVQTRQFSQAEIAIGRDPACECPIDDQTISTRHARLSYHHKQWWLEDLDSTNGTLLNGNKVEIPTVVVSGDKFECGQTTFTIVLGNGY